MTEKDQAIETLVKILKNRITVKEAAGIAGVHGKTIERWIRDNAAFGPAVGYHKSELNGRVTFDADRFRAYLAEILGDDNIRVSAPAVTDAEFETVTAIDKPERNGQLPVMPERSGSDPAADLAAAMVLPHKMLFTPKEAARLSGLSIATIKANSRKVAGKWKIRNYDLSDLVARLYEQAKPKVKRGKQ